MKEMSQPKEWDWLIGAIESAPADFDFQNGVETPVSYTAGSVSTEPDRPGGPGG